MQTFSNHLASFFGEAVCRESGDDVANPTEKAPAANPQSRSHNQPEEAAKKRAIVDLADAGYQQAQNCSIA
jgi:hypothetical protein